MRQEEHPNRQTRGGRDDEASETGDNGDGDGDKEASKEEKDRSRIDDLWTSFKRDTGSKSEQTLKQAATTVKSTQSKVHTHTHTQQCTIYTNRNL